MTETDHALRLEHQAPASPPAFVLSFGSLVGSLRGFHYGVPSTLGRWGNGHWGHEPPRVGRPLERVGKRVLVIGQALTP